jgi:hypothetical protein
VPPEDASAPFGNTYSRSVTEDLVDGFDLMMRASRKLADRPDPQLEECVERVVRELQQLEDAATAIAGDEREAELERLCAESARELKRVVEAVAVRVESVFSGRAPVGV